LKEVAQEIEQEKEMFELIKKKKADEELRRKLMIYKL
jgi:hypothetical protein